jgi:3-phytase
MVTTNTARFSNLAEAGKTVSSIIFEGQKVFPTGFIPSGVSGTVNGVETPIGGLSGVTYDAVNKRFYAISDDRSQVAPARFYTFTANLPQVNFTKVTKLMCS